MQHVQKLRGWQFFQKIGDVLKLSAGVASARRPRAAGGLAQQARAFQRLHGHVGIIRADAHREGFLPPAEGVRPRLHGILPAANSVKVADALPAIVVHMAHRRLEPAARALEPPLELRAHHHMAVGENVAPHLQGFARDPLDGMTPAFQAGIKILDDDCGCVCGGHGSGNATLSLCRVARQVRKFDNLPQITRSFPPSTGICAPVTFANKGDAIAATMLPMSLERISTFMRFLVLYSSTVML